MVVITPQDYDLGSVLFTMSDFSSHWFGLVLSGLIFPDVGLNVFCECLSLFF